MGGIALIATRLVIFDGSVTRIPNCSISGNSSVCNIGSPFLNALYPLALTYGVLLGVTFLTTSGGLLMQGRKKGALDRTDVT
jgi:hypothetical protein